MGTDPIAYVVDDDDAVRDSVLLAIELAGYRGVGFELATDFLAAAPTLEPGCLIVDVRMPEMDGLQLQEQLASRGLRFPIIVMTGHGDIATAVRAMKQGAVDFMEKPFSKETLLGCIENAFQGLKLDGRPSAIDAEAAERLSRLSGRERQVLDRLIEGLPNKTIAYDLSLSARTVEVYRARLMDKMMVRSVAELVRCALAGGIAPHRR